MAGLMKFEHHAFLQPEFNGMATWFNRDGVGNARRGNRWFSTRLECRREEEMNGIDVDVLSQNEYLEEQR